MRENSRAGGGGLHQHDAPFLRHVGERAHGRHAVQRQAEAIAGAQAERPGHLLHQLLQRARGGLHLALVGEELRRDEQRVRRHALGDEAQGKGVRRESLSEASEANTRLSAVRRSSGSFAPAASAGSTMCSDRIWARSNGVPAGPMLVPPRPARSHVARPGGASSGPTSVLEAPATLSFSTVERRE